MRLLPWVLVLFVIHIGLANSETVKVRLVDSQKQPVSNAVVTINKHNTAESRDLAEAIMDQIDFAFDPEVLVIAKSQWVKFPNGDNVRHHVYSFSAANPFELKLFFGEDAPPVQFNQAGVVVLGCNIHDSMVGYIYVTDNEHHSVSNSEGIVQINKSWLIAGDNQAMVWHPKLSKSGVKREAITLNVDSPNQEVMLNITTQTDEPKVKKGFSSKFRRSG